jgi:hypothetical protein
MINKGDIAMKRITSVLFAAVLFAGTVPCARADEPYNQFDRGVTLVKNDTQALDIWGRGQMIGVGQLVPETAQGADHERIYEFLKEARLGFNGKEGDLFNYQIEFAYGGENQNTLQSEAGGYDLLDFVADVPVRPLGENAILKLGQFRVPYGREVLQDEGYQDFGDRSIASLATNHGRDFGLAIMDTWGNWTGTLGTFPDGGRDIAQRYLPEEIGIPELVFRFGYNDGVDKDIYHVMGTDRNLNRDTKAAFVNGLFETDSRIGHSTALLSHSVDGNLLDSTLYNPYLQRANNNGSATCSAQTCQRAMLWNVGGDAVYRHPLGDGRAVEVEGEVDWGGFSNGSGELHIASARAQGDYQVGPWEIGLRYALLSMDTHAGFLVFGAAPANSTYATKVPNLTGSGAFDVNPQMGKPIHEIDPSITYHFKGHTMKLVADLPIYVDDPLFIDHTDGTYVFGDPTGTGQDGVIANAGNVTERRTIYEPRMMFQFQF